VASMFTPPIFRNMIMNPRSGSTIEEFNTIWREIKERGFLESPVLLCLFID
jgi:hypothetical protein